MTKRLEIISRIKEILGEVGIPVYLNSTEPFSRKTIPAIAVETGKGIPTEEIHGFTDWDQNIVVTVFVKGENLEQSADPYIDALHKLIMKDKSLGGLVMNISPAGYNPVVIDSDTPVGVYENTYLIKHRTIENDLSQ